MRLPQSPAPLLTVLAAFLLVGANACGTRSSTTPPADTERDTVDQAEAADEQPPDTDETEPEAADEAVEADATDENPAEESEPEAADEAPADADFGEAEPEAADESPADTEAEEAQESAEETPDTVDEAPEDNDAEEAVADSDEASAEEEVATEEEAEAEPEADDQPPPDLGACGSTACTGSRTSCCENYLVTCSGGHYVFTADCGAQGQVCTRGQTACQPLDLPSTLAVTHSSFSPTDKGSSISVFPEGMESGAWRDIWGSQNASVIPPLGPDLTVPQGFGFSGQLLVLERPADQSPGGRALLLPLPGGTPQSIDLSCGDSFYANPHDALWLSSAILAVTRYDRQTGPGVSDVCGGDDLAAALTQGATGNPVIKSYSLATARTDPVQARPDRILLAFGHIYVSLNEISGDFSSYGPGTVVEILPNDGSITRIFRAPTLQNCSAMVADVATGRLWVACNGQFTVPASAGLWAINLGDAGSTEVKADILGGSASGNSLAIDEARLYYIVPGDFATTGDTIRVLNTANLLNPGVVVHNATGSASYVFPSLTLDPRRGILFIADGQGALVQRYALHHNGDSPSLLAPLASSLQTRPTSGVSWIQNLPASR